MANLALIRGAAMAAPKFTDIRAAVEPGIRNFKTFASMMQKEKEKDELEKKREDEIKFNLYANLPGLEDELVPEMFKGTATQKALEVRNQQKALINNKENMDQYEFIDQMKSLNKQVAGMNKDFSAYKEWSANWVDLKDSDDLSSGMSANDRKQILDVLEGNGKPIYTDKGIGIQLENGEVKMLNNLPKVVPIAHDKHRDIQNSTLKVAEALGSKGIGSDDPAYINRMNTIISDFKRGMSSQDALSLGADFLKTGGQLGEYAGIIKKIAEKPELVETMTFNDRDEFGKVIGTIKGMEGYKEFIADQYALIAKTTNDSLKEAYDKKTATKSQQGRGSTNKWEFDEIKRRKELQVIAKTLTPLGKILNNKPINKEQSKSIINYANNNLPGVEIYQSTATDDDGNLLNPNAYVIDIDGKRKPFVIGETQGTAVFKLIKDLYGYSATERITMFDTKKDDDDFDESAYEITPSIDVVGTLEDINKADTLSQLNEKSALESAKNRIQKEQAGIR